MGLIKKLVGLAFVLGAVALIARALREPEEFGYRVPDYEDDFISLTPLGER